MAFLKDVGPPSRPAESPSERAVQNAGARGIDMTSFDFVTATCGTCHPGGGPMELDRDGKRYANSKEYSSSTESRDLPREEWVGGPGLRLGLQVLQ